MDSPASPREPILNIPFAMTVLLVTMTVIHGIRALLPLATDQEVIWTFGFVPARYDASVLAGRFPGGIGAEVWTFLTYAFLHADITHIAFNLLWMLPFGSAVARRFGTARFFAFFAITAIAGAFAHLVTHQHEVAPMIGASAAVSGMMAAAIRFAFQLGGFLSFRRGDAEAAARVPALSLLRSLQNSSVLGFLAVWFGLNILPGWERLPSARPRRASPGRRISAVSSPDWCCFHCSIRCRARSRRITTPAFSAPSHRHTLFRRLSCATPAILRAGGICSIIQPDAVEIVMSDLARMEPRRARLQKRCRGVEIPGGYNDGSRSFG